MRGTKVSDRICGVNDQRPTRIRKRDLPTIATDARVLEMEQISIDAYVLDALMPDLVGHDHRPSALIVFLFLWRKTVGAGRPVGLSYRMIADGTGLSMRAAQSAIQVLRRRQLIDVKRKTATSIPIFSLRCHWRARED